MESVPAKILKLNNIEQDKLPDEYFFVNIEIYDVGIGSGNRILSINSFERYFRSICNF